MSRPSHVLFDFFGTLVAYSPSRTQQGYARTFQLLREAGSALDYAGFLTLWSTISEAHETAAAASLREFSMRQVAWTFLEEAAPAVDEALSEAFVSTYLAEWNKGVRYLRGLREMLQRLRQDHTLAVITNTHDPRLVPDHLVRMGIADLLEPVVTSVELGWRKPSARIFEHTLERLGARPEQCTYVGDDYAADYEGARAAGLSALLIDPRGLAPIPAADRLGSVLEVEARVTRV